jgi:hypothetical protein
MRRSRLAFGSSWLRTLALPYAEGESWSGNKVNHTTVDLDALLLLQHQDYLPDYCLPLQSRVRRVRGCPELSGLYRRRAITWRRAGGIFSGGGSLAVGWI